MSPFQIVSSESHTGRFLAEPQMAEAVLASVEAFYQRISRLAGGHKMEAKECGRTSIVCSRRIQCERALLFLTDMLLKVRGCVIMTAWAEVIRSYIVQHTFFSHALILQGA